MLVYSFTAEMRMTTRLEESRSVRSETRQVAIFGLLPRTTPEVFYSNTLPPITFSFPCTRLYSHTHPLSALLNFRLYLILKLSGFAAASYPSGRTLAKRFLDAALQFTPHPASAPKSSFVAPVHS